MKNLFLLRHAHSGFGLNDHDRELNEEGIQKCKEIVGLIQNYQIDFIYSSDSKRTKQTVENIISELDIDPEIVFLPELYQASVDDLLYFLEINSDKNNVLLVNHNPSISTLAITLNNSPTAIALEQELSRGFSPGSLAHYKNNNLISFWR